MIKVGLTLAGSDSSGGAGIQADIKAMQANGVYAASVITAVTAQNTVAVRAAYDLPLEWIEAQLDAVFDDLRFDVVKTGMLSSPEIIRLVARKLREREVRCLVVDPVMISKSGYSLLKPEAVETLKEELLPLATLLTPNAHEAAHLTGLSVRSSLEARDAAQALHGMGAKAVLVKGGHFEGEHEAVDVLFDGAHFYNFNAPHFETPHTHGTGCTSASSIAANLARGLTLRGAIARSKRYITDAIRHGLPLGEGHGPTHHFYFLTRSGLFPAADE